MRRISRALVVLSALALLVGACGGDTAETTTTTTTTTQPTTTSSSTSSSSTQATTTTTTYAEGTTVTTHPAGFASPLNGLPSSNEINLDRGAIGIKIDNHVLARPQAGILEADMIVETRVEAGITRFIAFYHDNDVDYVGPVRSARPTDSTIARALGAPLVVSGGQPWVQSLFNSRGVGLVGPGAAGLFRVSGRSAPHNLFGSTFDARTGAETYGFTEDPPTPLYAIDTWEYPEETAGSITMDWSDQVTVEWDYDALDKRYYRIQDDVAHETINSDGDRTQISAEVLVVLAGEFYTAFPPSSGTAVPAIDTAGSGPAWVFARGRVWQGTWERADYADPFVLRNADGSTAVVPAGDPWVSVFPEHRSISWS